MALNYPLISKYSLQKSFQDAMGSVYIDASENETQ